MAYNSTQLPVPSTAGDNVATDEIGGVKFQRVKLSLGEEGVASDVGASNPVPVTDATIQTLNDTLVLLASMLSANSPRIDAAGRMAVLTETGSVATTVTTVTTVATAAGGLPLVYSVQDVPLHIYNNIIVS